ncbi:hypothetical protein HGM15179_013393 [Zosterops borbonicus]|uniref:Uncharacterized protein n=1 Tax=Zosterops borbonicus TaxID=364589 RepID=A0A8K1G8Y8_9PASS|nr:hypothetical protein HGM15179_013393 [Zosterops borbonicus]
MDTDTLHSVAERRRDCPNTLLLQVFISLRQHKVLCWNSLVLSLSLPCSLERIPIPKAEVKKQRPGEAEIWKIRNLEKQRSGKAEIWKIRNLEKQKSGEAEIRKSRDEEKQRSGEAEIRRSRVLEKQNFGRAEIRKSRVLENQSSRQLDGHYTL